MSMLMSTSRRTCGSSSRRSRRSPRRSAASRGLLPLDLLEQHEIQLVQDGQQPRSSASPACPIGRRTPDAPTRCAARSCGSRNANRSSSSRRCAGADQSSMLAPTMLTQPPAASSRGAARRPRHPPETGNERHSCPGSSSMTCATPVLHDADGDVGRGALGADHVGRPVEGARASIHPAGSRVVRGSLPVRRHRGRRTGAAAGASSTSGARRGTAGSAARPAPSAGTGSTSRNATATSWAPGAASASPRGRGGPAGTTSRLLRRAPRVDASIAERDGDRVDRARRRSTTTRSSRLASGQRADPRQAEAQREPVVGGGERVVAQGGERHAAAPRVSLETEIYTLMSEKRKKCQDAA